MWQEKDKASVLNHYFGYSSFREGQEPIIDAILSGRDAAAVMPTGAGKSLCFQVPAILSSGITLVISPLISLMKDQVMALNQNGVRAAYLNSSLTPGQFRTALRYAWQGEYKIIYVAPERLATAAFREFAAAADISLVAVDEAHCVSQWGQDFRPSYLSIPEFIRFLPRRPVVAAFTATATLKVREDILRLLELRDPFIHMGGFNRENLYFEVRRPADKRAELLSLLKERQGKSGIIYCSTRKNVEQVALELAKRGYAAARYHAGLSDEERQKSQEDFLYDRKTVMVATNAFGMGIDKSNVSFVIHYNMPKDLESYYQEAGRAGRDGEAADCVLLYSGQDVITNQYLMDHAEENENLEPEARAIVRAQNQERLKWMTWYCHTEGCLRAYILEYFGEKPPAYCGGCGNCLRLVEERDVTDIARKIAACVKDTGCRYGVKLIIDVLRGANTERIRRLGLTGYPGYGSLKGEKESQLRDILRQLEMKGYLAVTEGDYPILTLGEEARSLLAGEASVSVKVTKEAAVPSGSRKAGKGKAGGRAAAGSGDPGLFDALRRLRAEIASAQGVPAYLVFSNAALEDMCLRRPRDEEEFLEVSGVGQAKLERYGEQFLALLRQYESGGPNS